MNDQQSTNEQAVVDETSTGWRSSERKLAMSAARVTAGLYCPPLTPPPSISIACTFKEHSGDIQEIFKGPSGNTQGIFTG